MAQNEGPRPKTRSARASEISRRTLLQAAALATGSATVASNAAAQGGGGGGGGQGNASATPVVDESQAPISGPVSETWNEPWVWRPSDWPGQQLDMNVVENENPGEIVGFGNPGAMIFSYNGATPGPTIRMRGDETLLLRLRNMLGQNYGQTYVGPYPDPNALPEWLDADTVNQKAQSLGQLRDNFCIGEHTNGVHSTRVTNIHTHGLHVRPGRNPDGTHSDNVILRVLPQGDLEKREEQAGSPTCPVIQHQDDIAYLTSDETVGFADYEFRLGDVQRELHEAEALSPQPHPPGTHWYHPHTHGATHNQVASGMAGFLIIEGDVDEAINLELTGERHPDPQIKSGPYDYTERAMLVQRVFVGGTDPDATTQELKAGGQANPATNGDQTPMFITMRPGAIERWRMLNGSVDGRGYKHMMVLTGQYDIEWVTRPNGNTTTNLSKLRDPNAGTFSTATRAEIEADKAQIWQLAFDGVGLIEGTGDNARYAIQDLSQQNAGTQSPLNHELSGNPNQAMLRNYEACFADAESVRNAYVRPNEVYMAPGNRTDLLFQAPRLEDGADQQVYTIVAKAAVLHSDDYQSTLQGAYANDQLAPGPEDIIIGYVVVSDDADSDPVPDYDISSLIDVLPDLPPYLRPISDDDVMVREQNNQGAADPDASLLDRAGTYRTRTITYSGWGAGDFPLVTTEGDGTTAQNFRAFVERDQASGGQLENLRYAAIPDTNDWVLLPPGTRTMGITGGASGDVIDDSDPFFPITDTMARKFNPNDPQRPRMLENTAEEWAIFNASSSLWADTSQTPPGQYAGHYPAEPLLRAEGQRRFAEQPNDAKTWRLQTKSVDHPFHMHQNPYWVMRVEVPDENGNLVNILDQPRWQDVVWIPRNGGRVVFRSRFPDYVGAYVNHCHILLHEDNGMMQVVEATPFADQANYEPKTQVASADASAEEVSAIYPPMDPARQWWQSMHVIDPNPSTGQTFPGFVLGPPPGAE